MIIKKMHSPLVWMRSKLSLRLWATMMILVLFNVAFLWIVQIQLFEPNYVNATMEELVGILESFTADIDTIGAANADNQLSHLSKTTNSKTLLVDQNGEILYAYGSGLPSQLDDGDARRLLHNIDRTYRSVVDGARLQEIDESKESEMMLSLSIPLTYEGAPAALFVFSSMNEIATIQDINRRQLLMLSAAMTLVASSLAYFFTRQFTKPIYKIKDAVNLMAQGELTATPQITRHDELGQLSISVVELGQVLQRVDVLRKEVIANVSHELRTPLSLIMGYSEMVRDITWVDEERRKRNLDLIIREVGRLSQMVDDIMDYSQLQAGYAKLNKAQCNLYEIVEQEVSLTQEMAREHAIPIILDSFSQEIDIYADALKISQVMRNLLNNAINHTADGESIHVAATKEEGGIKITVTNPGNLIPEEERELIWERYRRVQHQGGRRQGTGIGLAIVSTILTAHDIPFGVECTDKENIFWFIA